MPTPQPTPYPTPAPTQVPVHKSNRRQLAARLPKHNAIDASSTTWRCGLVPLVPASTAAFSPRGDLVQNARAPSTYRLICSQANADAAADAAPDAAPDADADAAADAVSDACSDASASA